MKGPRTFSACCTLAILTAVNCGLAGPALEWADRYDGGGLYTDEGTAALASPDGHLIIAGESHDGTDGSDMLIRRLDRLSPEPVWTTRFPAFDGNDMALTGMVWDGFGDILVGGYIRGCEG
jgi:hypothetical protein